MYFIPPFTPNNPCFFFMDDHHETFGEPFLLEVSGLGLYADAVKKQLENAPDVIGMQEGLKGISGSWEELAKRG